jgi:hypothetical protein
VWGMIVMGVVDWLFINLPILCAFAYSFFTSKLSKSIKINSVIPSFNVNRTSTISMQIKMNDAESNKSPIQFAIMDLVTNLPHTKSILFTNNQYILNYSEEIKIGPELFVVFNELEHKSSDEPAATNTNAKPPHNQAEQQIHIYSYTLNMENLREELDHISKNYLLKIKNKLGNQIYYFNELVTTPIRGQNGHIDYTKIPNILNYTMKPFYTNRKFTNLFGPEVDIIKKRVNFFKNNKKWYDDKGIPYTLGILMSGQAGAGKTSTIKCLANELKRHIVNVQLTNTMTKMQLENLFFNDIISVTQNGKTEQYCIPIENRLFVFEDVDCQCDIVNERKIKSFSDHENEKNLRKQMEVDEEMKLIKESKDGSGYQFLKDQKQKNETRLNETINSGANEHKITLSFLLNLLDGVLETPGRIIIMSANWIDKLDHALIRPGRFDIISVFKKCETSMIIRMFEHYYDTKLSPDLVDLINRMKIVFISPAELSKLLFENFGQNLDGAIKQLVVMYQTALDEVDEPQLSDAVSNGGSSGHTSEGTTSPTASSESHKDNNWSKHEWKVDETMGGQKAEIRNGGSGESKGGSQELNQESIDRSLQDRVLKESIDRALKCQIEYNDNNQIINQNPFRDEHHDNNQLNQSPFLNEHTENKFLLMDRKTSFKLAMAAAVNPRA